MVISQCGKGRLFLGRSQPGGQDSPHLPPGRTRPTLGNDLQKAQESRCPELSFNARLSQHKEVYTVLIKAGPGAKPDQREVTCLESLHRDQVAWASSPSRHTCHTQGFFPHPGARRLAGLLVTEGPHGRTGSQGEVGALGHQEEHQIAAWKQPQKAFTSSHTTLRRGNTQVLLLGTKHCKTGAENTGGGDVRSKPSQNQLSELHHPPCPPTTTPVQPQRCPREGTTRCSSEHVSWEGTRERGRTSTTSRY